MKHFYLAVCLMLCSAIVNAQETQNSILGKHTKNNVIPSKTNDNNEEEENIVWEQQLSTAENTFSISSSHFNLGEWGMYAADDFEIIEEAEINALFFHGSQAAEDGEEYINGINLYFYADDEGKPAGNPSEEESAILEVIGIPIDSEFLTVEPGIDAFLGNKEYHIDLEGYLGEKIVLSEGIYWLSIVFDLELEDVDFDIRWLWSDSNTENLNKPMVIDPTDGIQAGLTDWTLIEDAGFPMTDMAFTLYGETDVLSIPSYESNKVKLYPNPTTDFLNLSLETDMEILNITAVDLAGKTYPLNANNDKVDLSKLSTGTYVLKIQTNKGLKTQKIIKK